MPAVTAAIRIVDPVGPQEIAERLEVSVETVHSWRKRARTQVIAIPLPEPVITISGIPLWGWATILKWARYTGRAA